MGNDLKGKGLSQDFPTRFQRKTLKRRRIVTKVTQKSSSEKLKQCSAHVSVAGDSSGEVEVPRKKPCTKQTLDAKRKLFESGQGSAFSPSKKSKFVTIQNMTATDKSPGKTISCDSRLHAFHSVPESMKPCETFRNRVLEKMLSEMSFAMSPVH